MSKHTPGPWRVDGNYIGAGYYHLALLTKTGADTAEEWKANARLFAAAPELLEALQMLMRFAPNHFTECQYTKSVWQDAAAAIAKAEGGEG